MGVLIDSSLRPEEALFFIMTDLWWDELNEQLYFRRQGYAPSRQDITLVRVGFWVVDEDPLFGDATPQKEIDAVSDRLNKGASRLNAVGLAFWNKWENISVQETLNLWATYLSRFNDRQIRAKEFLKVANLQVYFDLERRLSKLIKWEAEDREILRHRLEQLNTLPKETLASLFLNEPFWKREEERGVYRFGKIDIEKWLYEHGYDATNEISSFDPSRQGSDASHSGNSEGVHESDEDRFRRTVDLSATEYLRMRKSRPKVGQKLLRHQPSARMAVEKEHPDLKGKDKIRMIDRVRGATPNRVKEILKTKKRGGQ